MAAVHVEVLSSGIIWPFVLLFLFSIFLVALCSNCNRRSFELRDSDVNKNPSALIKVVKLEESGAVRENPMISEIQSDEKDFRTHEEDSVSFTPWRSHLVAPQLNQDVRTNGDAAVKPSGGDHAAGADSSAPSDHIYHTIGPPTNQEPEPEDGGGDGSVSSAVADSGDKGRSSVYAQVSRKGRQAPPPDHTPEELQVGEEPSPPLPDRQPEM